MWAHVVFKLGEHPFRAGHAAYVKAGGSERVRAANKALRKRVKERYPSLDTSEDIDGVVPPAVLRKFEEIQQKQDADRHADAG